uniref:Uncharacterized protein n=1 Tax=Anguilla anguilla TaxID=7936 RepID=A0A0E9PUB5_ANGAN
MGQTRGHTQRPRHKGHRHWGTDTETRDTDTQTRGHRNGFLGDTN